MKEFYDGQYTVKGILTTVEKLEKEGFDFTVYKSKKIAVFPDGTKVNYPFNMYDNYAICIHPNGVDVLLISLEDNNITWEDYLEN